MRRKNKKNLKSKSKSSEKLLFTETKRTNDAKQIHLGSFGQISEIGELEAYANSIVWFSGIMTVIVT